MKGLGGLVADNVDHCVDVIGVVDPPLKCFFNSGFS